MKQKVVKNLILLTLFLSCFITQSIQAEMDIESAVDESSESQASQEQSSSASADICSKSEDQMTENEYRNC